MNVSGEFALLTLAEKPSQPCWQKQLLLRRSVVIGIEAPHGSRNTGCDLLLITGQRVRVTDAGDDIERWLRADTNRLDGK